MSGSSFCAYVSQGPICVAYTQVHTYACAFMRRCIVYAPMYICWKQIWDFGERASSSKCNLLDGAVELCTYANLLDGEKLLSDL